MCITIINQRNREISSDNRQKVKDLDAKTSFDICIQWSHEYDIELTKELVLRKLQEKAIRKSKEK